MTPAIGAAALVAAGRYVIFHAGVEAGEERWSVEASADGGAVARGEQMLMAPHPLPCELEWRGRAAPLGGPAPAPAGRGGGGGPRGPRAPGAAGGGGGG